jgi:Rrf2 family nitric oxide-sensitive transcriptional repressor
MYLASFSHRAKIGEVADFFNISSHHVAKVVNQLARLGYVRSIRGVGGGIELAKSPEDITIGEVVLSFEGNMHLLECVGVDYVCAIQSFCKLRGVLAQAEQVQLEFLKGVTLQDILPTPRQLQQISLPN